MTSARTGVLPPPPGVKANFANPKSIAYQILIPAVLFPVIAITFCIVRLYTKRSILRLVTSDDCEYHASNRYANINWWRYYHSRNGTRLEADLVSLFLNMPQLFALGYSIQVCYGKIGFYDHSSG